ncbi:MAG: ATP-binding protein [Mariprofundaceae bacterium]|nr:ATP-binding protein [Mariprofundaceae bacterium]
MGIAKGIRPLETGASGNAQVAAERIRMLYRHKPFVLIGSLIAAAVTCMLFWEVAPRSILLSWFAATVVVLTVRLWVWRRFFVRDNSPEFPGIVRWGIGYASGSFVSGVLWGVLPWLVLNRPSIFYLSALVLILFGMVASAIGAHASYPATYFCFSIPTIILLAVRIAMEGGNYIYLSMLMLVFLIVNLGYSIMQYRMVTASIKQRFENLALLRDLEKKKSEAENANQGKSRFLAAASHDLRQPLYALDLFLGALDREMTTSAQIRIMQQAIQSSHTMGDLLNNLLDVSRLDAGQIEPDRHPFGLRKLIESITGEYGALVQTNHRLRLHVPDVALNTDAALFGQMLRNLISNAIKHTTGDILVGVRKRKNMLRLEVHDEGSGIPVVEREAIFSEFYQLNNPERDRNKGLGLGLAIVRRISAILNYPVSFENRPHGACFIISVPMRDVMVMDAEIAAPEIVAHAKLTGLFVLVIDDEEPIREGLLMLLRSLDCEVLTAASREEAVLIMRRDQYPSPDVLLVDYRFPGIETGVDVVEAIRHFFNKAIRAIIITGDTQSEIMERCRNAGCTYLTKPVQLDALIAILTGKPS